MRRLNDTLAEYAKDRTEYLQYLTSLRASVLTSFYTPPAIVGALASTIYKTGSITAERILDPSAGTGTFAKAFSNTDKTTETVCFEREILCGRIMKALHPDFDTHISSFQLIAPEYDGTFDIVTSNIPFGTTHVFDKAFDRSEDPVRRQALGAVHNYFFLKGVDMLREGGLLAFITSQGVMDSETNTPVRKWLMQHCNLISAIRLPHNLFTDYAGTAVGSDLLVLQKDSSKTALHNSLEEEFMQTLGNERHITMNKLFARHDNLILHTSAKQDKDPYGKPAMIYTFDGTTEDMAGAINGILSRDMERRFDRELYLKNMSERKRHVSLTATARQFAVTEKQADDTAAEYSFAVTSETAANETEHSFPQGTETVSGSTDNDSPQSGNADIPTTSAMLAGGLFSSFVQGDLFSRPAAVDASTSSMLHHEEKLIKNRQEHERLEQMLKRETEPCPYTGKIWPFYRNGTLVAQGGRYGYLRDIEKPQVMFEPVRMNTMQRYRAEAYIPLRDTYQQLYRLEADNEREYKGLRRKLNTLYDTFVRTIGALNGKDNAKFILSDATGREILSLERIEGNIRRKADIFAVPVSFQIDDTIHADTPHEALTASLNRYGRVNLAYMEGLCDIPRDELIANLEGNIFYNPMNKSYEIADTFIAGNVIEKAEWIERYLDENPDDQPSRRSLEALRNAFPTPITFEELDFNFGERWITSDVYERFVQYLFELDERPRIEYVESLDEFSVSVRHTNSAIETTYCVEGENRKYNGLHLLQHALHNTIPEITKCIGKDENGKNIMVPDAAAIQMAESTISKIRQAFCDWLREQPDDDKQQLADRYNRLYNCFVRPKYDGSHQTFPGLDLKGLGISSLYDSQKDAI